MFRVNKTISIRVKPHHQHTSIELAILTLIEKHIGYAPLSHLDKKEISSDNKRTRRFFVSNAYTARDK